MGQGHSKNPLARALREIGDEEELPGNGVRSGIIDCVLNHDEFPVLLRLIRDAAKRADAADACWYVVRAGAKLYTTNLPPVEAEEIDAMYLLNVPPIRHRHGFLTQLLAHVT